MTEPANIKGHPIHPMLVVFPIGLWVFSLIADLIYMWGFGGPSWNVVAYYTMAGGIVGALLAAGPGLIDLLAIRDPQSKRIGVFHMIVNLVVVALYAVNLWLRSEAVDNRSLTTALSVIGVAFLTVAGWLGGELVYVRGVSVADHPTPPPRRS